MSNAREHFSQHSSDFVLVLFKSFEMSLRVRFHCLWSSGFSLCLNSMLIIDPFPFLCDVDLIQKYWASLIYYSFINKSWL